MNELNYFLTAIIGIMAGLVHALYTHNKHLRIRVREQSEALMRGYQFLEKLRRDNPQHYSRPLIIDETEE